MKIIIKLMKDYIGDSYKEIKKFIVIYEYENESYQYFYNKERDAKAHLKELKELQLKEDLKII